MSESTVGEKFDSIFEKTKKRIIVATFASNVDRVNQIIAAAVKHNRKVAVSGRSMINMIEVATNLGYLEIPKGTLISLDEVRKYNNHQIVIITTGSQGEPMSALTRMAFSDHKKVEITKDDLVIISASPIPGNEKPVSNVINELYHKGAEVIHQSLMEVHVSGHACREELKIIMGLTKPKYFIPVHGEHRHLLKHSEIAYSMGIPEEKVFRLENGQVLELDRDEGKVTGTVPAGRVLVDGYGVGDVGNIVLRDRKHLSQYGIIIASITLTPKKKLVAGPDIISRGFVYVRENEDLMEALRQVATDSINDTLRSKNSDWTAIKTNLRSALGDFIYEKTKRKPMILPIIQEVDINE